MANQKPQHHTILKLITFITLIFFFVKCGETPIGSSNDKVAIDTTIKKDANNTTPSVDNVVIPNIPYIFNVPRLIGKNINSVRHSLGKPTDSEIEPNITQRQAGVDEWDNTFTKQGYDLLVTYNPRTRKVIDFFIGFPNGAATDYGKLLAICNVKQNTSLYKIVPVPANTNPSIYTGIKIIGN